MSFDDDEPYATVTQIGRWSWMVEVHHGLIVLTPGWIKLGKRRAQRCAERQLARYVQREERRNNMLRVRLAGGEVSDVD